MNTLSITGLRKEYSGFCLDGVNIELPYGCIMGLVGENGAGKTTLIKSILRMIKPDGGEIRMFGKSVSETTMEDVGVVLDEGCLPEKVTVADMGKLMQKFYKNWDNVKYAELINKFQLDPRKRYKDLSRGMKMKTALAIAMSHKASLLILDEATSGLDVVARDEVLDILLEYISDGQKSVLITSHIVTDLEKICDYICFLHHGRVVFMDEKDELLERFCTVRCSKSDFAMIPSEYVVGSRVTQFGAEVLMERAHLPQGMTAEKAGIEEVIVFHVKGEKK